MRKESRPLGAPLDDVGGEEDVDQNDGTSLHAAAQRGGSLYQGQGWKDGRRPCDFFHHPRIAAMLQAEPVRRAKREAFAMGLHQRLGAGSRARGLEEGVVRMVLEHV